MRWGGKVKRGRQKEEGQRDGETGSEKNRRWERRIGGRRVKRGLEEKREKEVGTRLKRRGRMRKGKGSGGRGREKGREEERWGIYVSKRDGKEQKAEE